MEKAEPVLSETDKAVGLMYLPPSN